MAGSPNPFGMIALWLRRFGEGIITLWFGLIANIPSGFVLCDGTQGTPDLRGTFPSHPFPAEPIGTTGGTETHTHTATTDGHYHSLDYGAAIESDEPGQDLHKRTSTDTDTLTTDPSSHLAAWHALAYIMET